MSILVKNLWNCEKNKWIPCNSPTFDGLRVNHNWKEEYAKIKRSIPQKWMKILKKQDKETLNSKVLKYNKVITIKHNEIKVNGKVPMDKTIKSKDLYYHILYPQKQPTCFATWSDIFEKDISLITWKTIFERKELSLQDRKRIDFNWKVIHRAIYTENRLQRMGKSNGIYAKFVITLRKQHVIYCMNVQIAIGYGRK